MTFLRRAIFAAFLSCIASACSRDETSSNSFQSGPYDPAFVEQVKTMSERIRAEASTQPAHPFAGQYFQGDGLGVNLTLDIGPSGAYTLSWHGCLGLYHLEHGTAAFEGSAVRLRPAPGTPKNDFRVDRELTRVPWGKRTYLLAGSDMASFVEWINKDYEPRRAPHGSFYLRDGDEALPAEGDPELPADFKERLHPLATAAVLSVGAERAVGANDPNYVARTVTLDIGANRGVTDDTIFRPTDGRPLKFFVVRVARETCDAEISGARGGIDVAVGSRVIGRVER